MYEGWLNRKEILNLFKDDSFNFNHAALSPHDEVGLRLRKEIVDWLGAPIVSSDRATIIFKEIKDKFSDDEAFEVARAGGKIFISANKSIGCLYGFYELIRQRLAGKDERVTSAPDQPIRMIDQWDQIDGSVERGYAGASILFGDLGQVSNPDHGDFSVVNKAGDPFRHDQERIVIYARMLASIGINAISLNNVNVRGKATSLIIEPYLSGVKELADIFRGFGIKVYLAINWEAPKHIGHLSSSDPLNEDVLQFWENVCDGIYHQIPDFGGFIVKADSEGEPGPYQYGRTHAQGANMLAKAVEPHHGLIIWRAFVYNSKQDWRDRKTDRAKSAYDNFYPLDGKFADNVILQAKFGPIDFQTEEPLQPLFGALRKTNLMMEFEITAEYLGHQIDINYVVPQWSKMINLDTGYADLQSSAAKDTLKETAINPSNTGFGAVANVGMSTFWTGNPLALANLYGYGILCWHNSEDPDEILRDWLLQTFHGSSKNVLDTIFKIMHSSNETFKEYNAPLGVGFMVVPHYHYGPSVNGYEYDRWGTYHFADRDGVGVDRTQATGSGYTGLYPNAIAKKFEDPNTTPRELMLFFHHLDYKFVMPDGKTLIQTIYDQHFAGYEKVKQFVTDWNSIEGGVATGLFEEVQKRLKLQLQNALNWRDQVNTYFLRMSGISDDKGRTIYK